MSIQIHVDPNPCRSCLPGFVKETSWIGSTLSSHGTHVISTIIGYNYYAPEDAAAGFPLPPLYIGGIAPGATMYNNNRIQKAYQLNKFGKQNIGTGG